MSAMKAILALSSARSLLDVGSTFCCFLSAWRRVLACAENCTRLAGCRLAHRVEMQSNVDLETHVRRGRTRREDKLCGVTILVRVQMQAIWLCGPDRPCPLRDGSIRAVMGLTCI